MFHILIDGYNLLHASRGTDHDWTGLELEDARGAVIDFLATRRRPGRERITIVFDGASPSVSLTRSRTRGMEVLFSEPGTSADEVIMQMVTSAPNPRAFLVISDDREIKDAVIAAGAKVAGPRNFILRAEEEKEKRRKAPPPEPREKFTGVEPGQVDQWRRVLGFDDEDAGE